MYELEQNNEKAMSYFERAAEFFEIGGGTTSANQCKLKVAQFSAQLEQYVVTIYSSVYYFVVVEGKCLAQWGV